MRIFISSACNSNFTFVVSQTQAELKINWEFLSLQLVTAYCGGRFDRKWFQWSLSASGTIDKQRRKNKVLKIPERRFLLFSVNCSPLIRLVNNQARIYTKNFKPYSAAVALTYYPFEQNLPLTSYVNFFLPI